MKLLSRNENGCVFLIGKREKQMMFSLLRYYPMLGGGQLTGRSSSAGGKDSDHEALLREALEDQQQQNRKLLDDLLSAKNRFSEDELGFRFSLSLAEAEWLLQVFNDVRVGSWVKLGSPKTATGLTLPLTEEKVKLCWAMEIAGLFQTELLQALDSSK